MDKLMLIAMAGFALYVLFRALAPAWQVHVIAHPDQVQFVRGVPIAKRADFEQFLLQDLQPTGKLVILARWDRSRRLTTKITGAGAKGWTQRIRNYLMTSL